MQCQYQKGVFIFHGLTMLRIPHISPGDLDGFFGLFVDNLIQFLLILALCIGVIGMSSSQVVGVVLPGAALSLLVGNVYYTLQARKLAKITGRDDVTALPYGINTVSLFAFIFLIMLPVKLEAMANGASSEDAIKLAWQMGLVATFLSGVLEIGGAFIADWVRAHTPRAALLSTLAGIAISFIAIDFAMRTFAAPIVAFIPLGIVILTYFGRVKTPLKIPGGAWAVLFGTVLAWISGFMDPTTALVSTEKIQIATNDIGLLIPIPVIGDLIAGFTSPSLLHYLVPVILPMGLFNVLGSLQNIESAEAAGDRYEALPSLGVNGVGSVVAAVFGSCFPTTIYIGHPGWKALGARTEYSLLNGVVFSLIAVTGLTSTIAAIIPIEAGMAIVLWIGIVITAQAFQTTPKSHAPAVALGLFPSIAAWGALILSMTANAAGVVNQDFAFADQLLVNSEAFAIVGLSLDGLVALSQGFMLTAMIWAAMTAETIERRFHAAAVWAFIATILAFFGFIHAGHVSGAGAIYEIGFGTGSKWAIGYFGMGLLFFYASYFSEKTINK